MRQAIWRGISGFEPILDHYWSFKEIFFTKCTALIFTTNNDQNFKSFLSLLKFLSNFLTGEHKVTSICPILGQRYPRVVVGACPAHLQSPAGKDMPISYIGTPPYILGSDASAGTDVVISNLLAEKYRFLPKLSPTPQYLLMQYENGTKYGKKYQVGINLC